MIPSVIEPRLRQSVDNPAVGNLTYPNATGSLVHRRLLLIMITIGFNIVAVGLPDLMETRPCAESSQECHSALVHRQIWRLLPCGINDRWAGSGVHRTGG